MALSDTKASPWKGKAPKKSGDLKHKGTKKPKIKKPTKTEGDDGEKQNAYAHSRLNAPPIPPHSPAAAARRAAKTEKKKRPRGGRKHRSEQRKRQKAEAGDTSGDGLSDGSDGEAAAPPQKQPPSEARIRKIAELKNKLKQKKSGAEFEAGRALSATIARRGPAEQADWLWASLRRCLPVTDLERESSGLTASCMASLPPGGYLEAGLQVLEPQWRRELASAAGRGPGQPSLLIVSPAAMGAVSAIKACPQLNYDCKMAKLFAKHFKLEEQVEALAAAPVAAAAGTPHRLARLFEAGALSSAKLRWVVLDARLDAKGRSIADSPEVVGDWWALWEGWLKKGVVSKQAKVVLWGGDEQ